MTNLRTKTSTGLILMAVVGILSLGLGLALRPWFAERNASAAGMTPPQEGVVPLATWPAAGTPTPAPSQDEQLRQEINGIQVTAGNFHREKDKVLLDVCFAFPTNLDWTIWDADLRYDAIVNDTPGGTPIIIREPPIDGKQRVTPFEKTERGVRLGEPIWEDAVDTLMGLRCDTLDFSGVPAASTRFTFTLAAIAAYPREGEECDQAYLAKYQAALDARNTGIKIGCRHDEYIGGLQVVDKPAPMSLEEAQGILYSNDLFLDLRGIRGPWVFTFDLP